MDKNKVIFISCDYRCSALSIEEVLLGEYSISFWVDQFDAKQERWYQRLVNRIKLIFVILFKSDYFLHEIVVTMDTLTELKEYLEKQLSSDD